MKWTCISISLFLAVSASAQQPESIWPQYHKVQYGETIASLAEKYYGAQNLHDGITAILRVNPHIGHGPGIQRELIVMIPAPNDSASIDINIMTNIATGHDSRSLRLRALKADIMSRQVDLYQRKSELINLISESLNSPAHTERDKKVQKGLIAAKISDLIVSAQQLGNIQSELDDGIK